MFYLDLDEIDAVAKKVWLVSRDRFNFFSFRDCDHLRLTRGGLKENVLAYLRLQAPALDAERIMLLTNLRTLGYVFNPVSFYFSFNRLGQPVCAVAEVNNTFGETKPFFIGEGCYRSGAFRMRTEKHFYVSPFIDLDVSVDFNLEVPGEKVAIRVDDYKEGKRILLSSLIGEKRELTAANLIWYSLRYPLMTLRVITLIHWHALKLYLKRIPYHRKSANPDLQKGLHNAKSGS
jgi:DUF1365 family protein